MKVCPICSTEYPDDVKFCKNDGSALRALAPAADLVGQVVAERYHVIKKLGEGGMGQVYLAEHVKMGRRSAIKVLNPAMVHDPDAVARFNREASNASRVSHPNICAIYDFGETTDGLIYLAMEFVEGEPLTDVMEREGALPVSRAASIFMQVADALQAAHDLSIVHRDLKPDNIMLARGKGGTDLVKVVDFGIAKTVGGDDSQKVTKTGLVIGTPEFMSPEQLAGDVLDGRSDLYSLALVFYQMLTGILPFDADSAQETMVQRLTENPRSLADARPDLAFPPGLQACIDTALAREPASRYQTVAKFAGDVARVLGLEMRGPAVPRTRSGPDVATELIEALPASEPGSMRRRSTPRGWPRRQLRAHRLTIVLLVVLGGGTVGVLLIDRRGDSAILGGSEEPDQRQARGSPADTTPRRQQPDTVPRRAEAQRGNTTTPPRDEGGRPAASPRLTQATADSLIDRLIEASPRVRLDSAQLVYHSAGVSRRTRGAAACLMAQAHSDRQDTAAAERWAERGLALDTQLLSCTYVLRQMRARS